MKKYIIPIILAILIIALIMKGTNNGTIEKVESKINQVKQDLSSNKEKIEDKVKEKIIPKEDRLMADCKNSFKECKSIGIKKYGWSISLSETEKFYDKETAEEFYNMWNFPIIIGQELELDYPIILFAFSIKKGDNQLPDIAVCEDGELTESSKLRLGC